MEAPSWWDEEKLLAAGWTYEPMAVWACNVPTWACNVPVVGDGLLRPADRTCPDCGNPMGMTHKALVLCPPPGWSQSAYAVCMTRGP